eukprot:g45414.t1
MKGVGFWALCALAAVSANYNTPSLKHGSSFLSEEACQCSCSINGRPVSAYALVDSNGHSVACNSKYCNQDACREAGSSTCQSSKAEVTAYPCTDNTEASKVDKVCDWAVDTVVEQCANLRVKKCDAQTIKDICVQTYSYSEIFDGTATWQPENQQQKDAQKQYQCKHVVAMADQSCRLYTVKLSDTICPIVDDHVMDLCMNDWNPELTSSAIGYDFNAKAYIVWNHMNQDDDADKAENTKDQDKDGKHGKDADEDEEDDDEDNEKECMVLATRLEEDCEKNNLGNCQWLFGSVSGICKLKEVGCKTRIMKMENQCRAHMGTIPAGNDLCALVGMEMYLQICEDGWEGFDPEDRKCEETAKKFEEMCKTSGDIDPDMCEVYKQMSQQVCAEDGLPFTCKIGVYNFETRCEDWLGGLGVPHNGLCSMLALNMYQDMCTHQTPGDVSKKCKETSKKLVSQCEEENGPGSCDWFKKLLGELCAEDNFVNMGCKVGVLELELRCKDQFGAMEQGLEFCRLAALEVFETKCTKGEKDPRDAESAQQTIEEVCLQTMEHWKNDCYKENGQDKGPGGKSDKDKTRQDKGPGGKSDVDKNKDKDKDSESKNCEAVESLKEHCVNDGDLACKHVIYNMQSDCQVKGIEPDVCTLYALSMYQTICNGEDIQPKGPKNHQATTGGMVASKNYQATTGGMVASNSYGVSGWSKESKCEMVVEKAMKECHNNPNMNKQKCTTLSKLLNSFCHDSDKNSKCTRAIHTFEAGCVKVLSDNKQAKDLCNTIATSLYKAKCSANADSTGTPNSHSETSTTAPTTTTPPPVAPRMLPVCSVLASEVAADCTRLKNENCVEWANTIEANCDDDNGGLACKLWMAELEYLCEKEMIFSHDSPQHGAQFCRLLSLDAYDRICRGRDEFHHDETQGERMLMDIIEWREWKAIHSRDWEHKDQHDDMGDMGGDDMGGDKGGDMGGR